MVSSESDRNDGNAGRSGAGAPMGATVPDRRDEDGMATQDPKKASGTTTGPSGPRLRRSPVPATDGAGATPSPPREPSPAQPPPRRAERRPEMVRQRREERRRAYEKQRRQWLLTRIGLGAFGLLVVVGIGYGIYGYVRDRQTNQIPEGVQSFSNERGHTSALGETVAYEQNPPAGGNHAPAPFWQNCGAYDAPIQNEAAVHSLEHGAVWITYRPDLPQEEIDTLLGLARDQTYVIASAYPDLPSPVVASAWDTQLRLDSADDSRLDQFVRYYREGPQTPELGAACTGGVGEPL